ncbi:MAG: hypothetical protein IT438_07020 [Phycisphaerales bacterium]|nr:hypothetical protein [Phycisphaerales bacterium]
MPDPTPPIQPAHSAPTNSAGAATADERELTASIDALMAAGGTPTPSGAEADALDAVQSVEDLLADVAAELSGPAEEAAATDLAPTPAPDAPAPSSAATAAPAQTQPQTPSEPSAQAHAPTDIAAADDMLAAVAADLAAAPQPDEPPDEPESWKGRVTNGLAQDPAATPAPPEPHGSATMAREPASPVGSIDDLDQTLAESAEQVLADGQNAAAAAISPDSAAPAEPKKPEPSPPAKQPQAPAATTSPAPPTPAAPPAPTPVPATAIAPAAPRPSLLARALLPLATKTAALSPTVRQTISWLAVYTALLAVGVWGYLLVRDPATALEPTTDPTPFLKPGDVAPSPSSKAHAKPGHDDGHGNSAPTDGGHGSPKKADKKDSHGGDAHGPPKKDAKPKDAHGAPKSTDKKKPDDKKAAAKKDAGHH